MAKTRELRRRIKSVENTRQITKTMEMVATSRLKRAQDRVVATRPYAAALTEVLRHLYDPETAERFPLLRRLKGDPKRVALVLITMVLLMNSLSIALRMYLRGKKKW